MSGEGEKAILAAIMDLRQAQAQMRGEIAEHHGQIMVAIAELRGEQALIRDELAKARGDLIARMGQLEGKIAELRNDALVNYGGIERVDRRINNSDDQTRLLGEQVNLMFKRILGMEGSPHRLLKTAR